MLQYHQVDRFLDVTGLGHQPLVESFKLRAKQALDDPPVLLLQLDRQPKAILLFQSEVHKHLVLCLMETGEQLDKLCKW